MDKNYTLEYIRNEENHWWFTARRTILQTIIKKIVSSRKLSRPLHILNVGPAGGTTSLMLEAFGRVKSLEFDPVLYEYCKNELKLDVDNGSITELPYEDGTFDMACAFDVVEHVEDHARAMEELKRVVKKDGIIFITVPAYQFLWSRHDEINHHFRRYTKTQVIGLARSVGLNPFYSTYFNFLLFLPIVGARLAGKFTSRRKKGSDFEEFKSGKSGNKLLHSVFRFEKQLLFPLKLPFGVSIFAALNNSAT